MRVQFLFDLGLDSVRHGNRAGEQEFDSQEQHENETEQFHRRLNVAVRKKGGKACEGYCAIDDLHHHRSQPYQEGPFEPAPCALVQDGDVNGADGHGEQKPEDKTSQRRDNQGMEREHTRDYDGPPGSSSLSSSSSISSRTLREMRGRMKPYTR